MVKARPSLNSMLQAHDEQALIKLASVGLVRRARSNVEAGKALIESNDADRAILRVEGHTVELDGAGPVSARCSCPATGVCRHVLSAMLLLSETLLSGEEQTQERSVATDSDSIPVAGKNADSQAKSKQAATTISSQWLTQAEKIIERTTIPVLAGTAVVSAGELFELSISARVEAAPRLAGELRNLNASARQAQERSINFDPEKFLIDAASAYALVKALQHDAGNPALSGVVQRDYKTQPAMEFLMAVHAWTTPAGARGLTAHGFVPATGNWISTSLARGAGKDPGFSVRYAYDFALWRAGSMRSLSGKYLHMAEPRVSSDGVLATTLDGRVQTLEQAIDLNQLLESGLAFDQWSLVHKNLIERMGSGLQRQWSALPALFLPDGFGPFAFDELQQCYYWEVRGKDGSVMVQFDVKDGRIMERLHALQSTIAGMVVLANLHDDALRFVPVSILFKNTPGYRLVNLTLDALPEAGRISKIVGSFRDRLFRYQQPVQTESEASSQVAQAVLTTLVDCCGSTVPDERLEALCRTCESCGLIALSSALGSLRTGIQKHSIDGENLLRCAYLASEVLSISSLMRDPVI